MTYSSYRAAGLIAAIETFTNRRPLLLIKFRSFAAQILKHQKMNYPLITWSLIVGMVTVIVMVRFVLASGIGRRNRHPMVEIGSEREEFFVPGDPVNSDDYDDED